MTDKINELDSDKSPSFEDAYLEDSILSEDVIKMYNIRVNSYKGINLTINKPNYVAISDPVIKEDILTYTFTNNNSQITIWKQVLITHTFIH